MKTLILLPLGILFVLMCLSVSGLGVDTFTSGFIDLQNQNKYYYDSTGHPLVYIENLTVVGENGLIYNTGFPTNLAAWNNGTFGVNFAMYYDTSGALSKQVKFADLGKTDPSSTSGLSVDISTSLGFFALITGLVALALLSGAKIVSSGTSNSMILVLATGYGVIWGMMSAAALHLITAVALFGPIIYLLLTLVYALGVIDSFRGAGDD